MILAAGLTLVLFCMLGASVAGYALVKYNSIDRVEDLELHAAAEGEPENFLIVAVDTREGQGSVNTDTIMVVRVDPSSDRLALTSFPRDLIVTVADTGETGMINAAYNREDGTGPQNLIHTIQQNYAVPIHHFIEVNFESFKQVVDSVGGVPVWMDTAARDTASGLYSEDLGCVTLDGERGLEFVRARHLEIQDEDGDWVDDPQSDVTRVQRQQIFIQRAMGKVLADVKSNPLRLQELLDIGVQNVVLDPNLGISDLKGLGDKFKDFDPANFETYPLPTDEHPADENRLALVEAQAEPMLNVFRGLDPSEISPGLIDVQVLNGTHADPPQEIPNLASDVSAALQQVGFDMGAADDTDTFYAQTTIQHAPGEEVYAQRVARHITSTAAIPTGVNADLLPGQVVVIAGADFTTVHDQATPIEAMPAPPGAAPVDTTVPAEDTTATTVAETPVTTPTTENPFIIGSPPADAEC